MPEFEKVITHDMTPAEVIDFFKGQPMEFAPGKRWNYNNSGYFLLGAIIEKLSGMTYAAFLQKRIFDPLEMVHTCHDDPKRIIPNRASGYNKREDTLVNDQYISMTLPYSAGGLASTVDDLAAWDASLYAGKLVSLESLRRAWTPYRLADGEPVHYGYGWGLHEYQGSAWIEHGGGIHGFLCQAIRLPAERLYIAVLTNTTAPVKGPGEMASRAAAIALGKPVAEPLPVDLPAGALAGLAGIYAERPGEEFTVTVADGKLKVSRAGWPDFLLHPVGEDCFHGERLGLSRLRVLRGAQGEVSGFEVRNLFNEVDIQAAKTARPLPEAAN